MFHLRPLGSATGLPQCPSVGIARHLYCRQALFELPSYASHEWWPRFLGPLVSICGREARSVAGADPGMRFEVGGGFASRGLPVAANGLGVTPLKGPGSPRPNLSLVLRSARCARSFASLFRWVSVFRRILPQGRQTLLRYPNAVLVSASHVLLHIVRRAKSNAGGERDVTLDRDCLPPKPTSPIARSKDQTWVEWSKRDLTCR